MNGDMETLIHYGALALQTDWTTFRVMYDDAVMVESDDYREAVVLFFGTLEMQILRLMAARVPEERRKRGIAA